MRPVAILLTVLLVAGLATALFLRARWIDGKISAALLPPDASEMGANSACLRDNETIIIGDSRVSRWPMQLFGDMPVDNKGIAGETALHLASRFNREVLRCHAPSVLISSGINDMIAASLASEAQAREIVDRLPDLLIAMAEEAARAGKKVSLATIVPPSRPDLLRRLVWSEAVRGFVLAVNARLRAHRWTGAVMLIDFAAVLDPLETGILPDRFRTDTLHLNPAAYARLMSLLPVGPPRFDSVQDGPASTTMPDPASGLRRN